MEFPFGHHHRRDGREEEERPPPAPLVFGGPRPPPRPSYYGVNEPPPPAAPPVAHVHHSSHNYARGPGGEGPYDYNRSHIPPPDYQYHSQPPPPPSHEFDYSGSRGHGYPPPQQSSFYSSSQESSTTGVHHASHDSPIESEKKPHSFRPHLPSFLHHHQASDDQWAAGKRTVRVFTKAETNYSLTIRDGKVILAPSNPSDPLQHWFKDEKYSIRVKDEEGFPSFALVNKATGQAMKHSVGATHPVQLVPYNPDVLDESVLWTESRDLGDDYRTIRMINNIRLNVDAFHGDKNHGGVYDGTTIVLWEWKKGDNQRWKIIPY
ncbi:hypothetical protein NMG60_11003894 [Bertholletia excelsa]